MNPMVMFRSLDSIKKGAILTILLGVTVAVGLSVYSSYKLRLAHNLEAQADQLRVQATALRAEADTFKAKADILQAKLTKAEAKVAKLREQVDKIVVPPKPTEVPATTKDTLDQLSAMGLQMVFKPSTMIAPSVAGITGQDASKVWLWGKEAMRVPSLEAKLEKTAELVDGLDKAKGLAESLAEMKGKEADTWHKAADKHLEEADSIRVALKDTKSALAAQRKRTILIGLGALALGYAAKK